MKTFDEWFEEWWKLPLDMADNITILGVRMAAKAGWNAKEKECLEQVVAWALGLGFATGHANTLDDLLNEIKFQIKELQ